MRRWYGACGARGQPWPRARLAVRAGRGVAVSTHRRNPGRPANLFRRAATSKLRATAAHRSSRQRSAADTACSGNGRCCRCSRSRPRRPARARSWTARARRRGPGWSRWCRRRKRRRGEQELQQGDELGHGVSLAIGRLAYVLEQGHERQADGERFRRCFRRTMPRVALVADDARDAPQIDDGGAMDLLEMRRVQPRQQFAQEVRSSASPSAVTTVCTSGRPGNRRRRRPAPASFRARSSRSARSAVPARQPDSATRRACRAAPPARRRHPVRGVLRLQSRHGRIQPFRLHRLEQGNRSRRVRTHRSRTGRRR